MTPRERDKVLHGVGLEVGAVFLEDRWDAAKTEIRQRARNLGFATAEVKGRVLVGVDTQRASLTVLVRLGGRYRFGDIVVHSGPSPRVAPGWIWDEVRLAIPEGQSYSDSALGEAERRVFAMGVFVVAKVAAGTPDEATLRVPIVVETRESPLRMLRAGVGARIDQVREEARLSLEWSHLDFLGGMRKLTVRSEVGWAFLPNLYAVARNDVVSGARDGPIARLSLKFEQPRFLERPSLRERTTLDIERTLEQTYDSLGARLSTGVAWMLRSRLSALATYNLQGYFLNGPAIASVSAAPLTLGCAGRVNDCFILLSYLEQSVTWDGRDSPLDARQGFFASIAFQEGGGPLLGDFEYLRIFPDVRGYLSFGDRKELTFAARLRAGELVHAGAQSAVVTRFFAGGGVSMRGFGDRRLSPLLQAPAPGTSPSSGNTLTLPIGGDGLLEGSFETRYQLTESLVLAVFLDFGQVTQGAIGPKDIASVLWAFGVGLHYRTAIGPIRFELARRLQLGRPPALLTIDEASGAVSSLPYAVNDSCFGLGGSGRATPVPDSLCAFDIAIGEAF